MIERLFVGTGLLEISSVLTRRSRHLGISYTRTYEDLRYSLCDQAYDIQAVMTHEDETAVFEQSFTLGSGEGRDFGDDFPAGKYTLTFRRSPLPNDYYRDG